MNARGIPPAAYQVLLLLSYPGGYPSLARGGTPSLAGGTPYRGNPWPGLEYPLERDLGPVTGVLPGKDMGPVEVLWDGDGVPLERTWDQIIMERRWGTPTPPPGCELTNKLKLLMRAVKILIFFTLWVEGNRKNHKKLEESKAYNLRNTKILKTFTTDRKLN